MNAWKRAFLILPLLLSVSAMADEYVGSSGKGGKVADAPKIRATASVETPEKKAARTVFQCELVRDTVGTFLYTMFTNINSPSVVAGPWWGTEYNSANACKKERNKAIYANMKTKCSCATLAGAQVVPNAEQIAWANTKKSSDEIQLAKD